MQSPVSQYISLIISFPVLFLTLFHVFFFFFALPDPCSLSYLTLFLTGSGTSQGEDTGTWA